MRGIADGNVVSEGSGERQANVKRGVAQGICRHLGRCEFIGRPRPRNTSAGIGESVELTGRTVPLRGQQKRTGAVEFKRHRSTAGD